MRRGQQRSCWKRLIRIYDVVAAAVAPGDAQDPPCPNGVGSSGLFFFSAYKHNRQIVAPFRVLIDTTSVTWNGRLKIELHLKSAAHGHSAQAQWQMVIYLLSTGRSLCR